MSRYGSFVSRDVVDEIIENMVSDRDRYNFALTNKSMRDSVNRYFARRYQHDIPGGYHPNFDYIKYNQLLDNIDLKRRSFGSPTRGGFFHTEEIVNLLENDATDSIKHIMDTRDMSDREKENLLIFAVEHGNLNMIKLVFIEGILLDDILIKAVKRGDINIVKFLVDKGADVNVKGLRHNLSLPLFAALEHGNLDIAEYLLSEGVDLATNNRLYSILVKKENINILKYLEKRDPFFLDGISDNVIAAVSRNQTEMVKYLLQFQIDDEIINEAFVYAMKANNKEIVEFLIKDEYNITDRTIRKGISRAIENNSIEIIDHLIRVEFIDEEILGNYVSQAISSGNIDLLKRAIKYSENGITEEDVKSAYKRIGIGVTPEMQKYLTKLGFSPDEEMKMVILENLLDKKGNEEEIFSLLKDFNGDTIDRFFDSLMRHYPNIIKKLYKMGYKPDYDMVRYFVKRLSVFPTKKERAQLDLIERFGW